MAQLIKPQTKPVLTHCPVRCQAIYNSHSLALKTDQQSITYLQLDNLLIDLQSQLEEQNETKKDELIRLVCISHNSIELLLLQLICVRLGWCFCPLNPRFTETEIEQRLAILNSDNCWVNGDLKHQKYNTLNLVFNLPTQAPNTDLSIFPIHPQQPCNIIFTSGSSGFPKAIVHNYKNHFYSALGSQHQIPLEMGDQNLLSLPLFHIGGYATVMRSMIAGACIHLSASALALPLLQQRKITHLSLVSTQLVRLLTDQKFNQKNTSIKHILLGGSAFSEHLLTALTERGFEYHLSYGCTEMASQVATSTNSTRLKTLPYRQVKIQNESLLLRGETRFLGYFKDNKVIEIDPEQWIDIGDTGQLQENELTISGRKDRQFISGGENIRPEEIERICLQQPEVKQAYVCPVLDQEYGQRVALFISFYEQQGITFAQQKNKLQQTFQNQLSTFKQPNHFLPWPSINNNQALKVPKQVFRTILKNKKLI